MNRIKLSAHSIRLGSIATLMSLSIGQSFAGAKLDLGENRTLNLDLGIKASVATTENGAANDSDNSLDFDLESARLYLYGDLSKKLSYEITADYSNFGDGGDNALNLLDASINYRFSDSLNIRAGRFINPTDRANMAGPYFSNTWDYPVVVAVNGIPPVVAGRDEGVAIWGQPYGGKIKYYLGVFEGETSQVNSTDSPLYAARLEYNFWDPEPGYYNANIHYGDKDILSLAVNAQSQDNAVGNGTISDAFRSISVDFLLEKKLSNAAVFSLEGAFYDYDYSDLSAKQGDGFLLSGSYLFPQSQQLDGRVQLLARTQQFDRDHISLVTAPQEDKRHEIGLHYILRGHSAKWSLVLADQDIAGVEQHQLRLGFQYQTF